MQVCVPVQEEPRPERQDQVAEHLEPSVHVVDARKRPVLPDDLGCGSTSHVAILVGRERRGE